jgi:hypothetical protein
MIIYFIKSISYDHINKKYNSHEFLKIKSEYVYQVRQNPPKPPPNSAKTRQKLRQFGGNSVNISTK